MVVGGYTPERQLVDSRLKAIKDPKTKAIKTNKGRTNDVELINLSEKTGSVGDCSKFVTPLVGEHRKFEVKEGEETIWENEGEIFGLTGVFSKDAAIVCGGKNRGGKNEPSDLNICWEWDSEMNR